MTMTNKYTPSTPARATPAPTHSNPANRDTVDNERKGKAFQDRLSELGKAGKEQTQKAAGQPRIPKAPLDQGGRWQGKRDERAEDLATAAGPASGSGSNAALVAKASFVAPPVDASPPEHLARIAAALQALIDNGGTGEFHLQLPVGPTAVEGAVIGRDPTGRIQIQLQANAVLPPAALQKLQSALAERMKDRMGKLGVTVSEQRGGNRPGPSLR